MLVTLWKGYHSAELASLIATSWDDNTLLILCPPLLNDFSFLAAIPSGPIDLRGTWTESERAAIRLVPRPAESFTREVAALGVFTSGTLSLTPKLVLYSRRNVLASLDAIYSLFDLGRIRHVFCYPQAFHTFGLTLGYLASHKLGWKLHTPEGKYSSASHRQRVALREEQVLTLGTPTHFFDLAEMVSKSKVSLTPSYSCIMGGAPVSRALWARVHEELKIEAPSTGYGCTEAAPGITHLAPGQRPEHDDEIGSLLPSIQTRFESEQGVWISGESLCIGIVRNGHLEIPTELCIRDHLEPLPTASWLYRGRLDLLMNRGGAKYSLEAIEKTVFEKTGIHSVACRVRDARLGEDLALAFQEQPHLTRAQMLRDAQTVLSETFALKLLPERTQFVADFPINECSKLDRKSVASLFNPAGDQ